jgi:LPXTG-motif cell wall-anchored protein
VRGDQGGLPVTGGDVLGLTLTGVALLGAGATLRWRARRH